MNAYDVQTVIDNITEKRSNGDLLDIPVSKLVVNPYQPRKIFDIKELEGLAQSIKENGLFSPILVKENEAGDYYIVFRPCKRSNTKFYIV